MADSILCLSGIYAIRNIINGKAYVGRAKNLEKRKRRHLAMLCEGAHHSPKLQSAYQKYGPSAFVAETLLLCHPEHLEFFEQLLIDGLDACVHGYNICPISGAPMAGRTNSAASNIKRSAAMVGRAKPASVKKKLSQALAGRKHSAQRIEAIRASVQTPEIRNATSIRMRGNKNALGSVRSAAAKANYSASWTPERRAAASARYRTFNNGNNASEWRGGDD